MKSDVDWLSFPQEQRDAVMDNVVVGFPHYQWREEIEFDDFLAKFGRETFADRVGDWIGEGLKDGLDFIREMPGVNAAIDWMKGKDPDHLESGRVNAEEPIPSPEETRAILAEWKQDYTLRSMPESVRDVESNSLSDIMEAVGNSPLPGSLRNMEADFHSFIGEKVWADMPSVYHVWQADMPAREGEPPLDFPEAYTKVASVEARSLAEAVELTKHIDHPWQENPGVEGEVGARSTGVGDVIVAPDGKSHRVEAEGFSAIRSTYEKQLDEAADRGKYIPKNDRGIER
jgi:hypothetical protein